ncbi:hypothetical protein F4818DRAFT_332151 [Hypoxylon cercidicola]|nr:hypothetical protein F4818DRAFT_332151 [Hypoxylon cercidicola]
MKPVKMADFSRRLLTQNSLLFLNTSKMGLRYATQLLSRDITPTSIRSKGGICLPNEIWTMILKFILKSKTDIKDRVCLVKAELVVASSKRMLLRCFRHEFDYPKDEMLASFFPDTRSVLEFESYLADATPSAAETLTTEFPKLHRLSGPDNTYHVVLDTTSTDLCLYTIRDVPDLIAVMDDGDCWVCDGGRFICPGCTGGKAQKFGSFMGCGVDLACPLCMGIDFSAEHKAFLQEHYWDEAPEDEAEDMFTLIEERLEELGYMDMGVPGHAYEGGQ